MLHENSLRPYVQASRIPLGGAVVYMGQRVSPTCLAASYPLVFALAVVKMIEETLTLESPALAQERAIQLASKMFDLEGSGMPEDRLEERRDTASHVHDEVWDACSVELDFPFVRN